MGKGRYAPGMTNDERLCREYNWSPPIIRAAVDAILAFEHHLDAMGYDLSYYQEDLPRVVAEAIAPWKEYS
jgi:hypothetical protein